MLIVSNLPGFPSRWKTSSGETGESVVVQSAVGFLGVPRDQDAVWLVNGDARLTYQLSLTGLLMPWRRRPLVAVDLVLGPPRSTLARVALPLKRVLLRRVSHFIHYFRDLSGYQAVYGIGAERSSFVPFKANIGDRHAIRPNPEGEYVLCFGSSWRDYDTFFSAMERLPHPGAIARPNLEQLRAHGGRFTRRLDQLPANVSVLDDDGSEMAQIRILERAKVVALPVLGSHLAASGLSVSLNAMLMGKCVIGSEGPGMSDIFPDQAILVPPEDPASLADAIRRAWEDDELRRATAMRAHVYARSLGGEAELFQRMIEQVVLWRRTTRPSAAPQPKR